MGPSFKLTFIIAGLTLLGTASLPALAEPPAKTGPETEKRFPPLKVPEGFKATLFACDPLIEYPSVIAAGPRPGAIFVAYDYMTGLGTEIVRRDEIRLVEDTNGDGYADKSTLYATGFNSIMGLAYHDGAVYVMHAPFLTALRDTKGTGQADERKDLLSGLGLTPEKNPVRLHCANGVTVGHDGWLYLAMGDNGVDVPRPEGDRLVLQGGGILRCRPDGRDLHVYASGLRNIYDVALDAELNVFVRDNENDGGTYKIRVCHSFHGADHGYPYLYEERPDEALKPLGDMGLGSSAGVACYLERQFPAEYRGNLIGCEWGKSVVRYPLARLGSSFVSPQENELAASAPNDPYGFKPTDVIVQRDGTLMVSDWADGQRPLRGRGRIYTLAYVGERARGEPSKTESPAPSVEGLLSQLDSDSYYERSDAQLAIERKGEEGLRLLTDSLAKNRIGPRGRLHAVWILAKLKGRSAIDDLLRMAKSDSKTSVRAQAIRAVADLSDPLLVRHKLDAGGGDAELASRIAELGKGQDPTVLLEVTVALGRIRWTVMADWVTENLKQPDLALAHATMQALRRSENWPSLMKLVDLPSNVPVRAIALRAIAQRYEPAVVDGLIERLGSETDAVRRREYADALARVYQKPAPWVYWGYRPAPRPANTVPWERTEAIAKALNRLITESPKDVRTAVLKRMQREKVPVSLASLKKWLEAERDAERVAALLASLKDQPAAEGRATLAEVVRDVRHSPANRVTALSLFVAGLDDASAASLLTLAEEIEDGPLLAEFLQRVAKFPKLASVTFLVRKAGSTSPEVRAAAIESLGELRAEAGMEAVVALLADKDTRVRRAAANAAGRLNAKGASEPLLKLVTVEDSAVRRAAFDALRSLKEPRVVPLAVAALADQQVDLVALECLNELGGHEQAGTIATLASRHPTVEVSAAVIRVLSGWRERNKSSTEQRENLDRLIAEVQGTTGMLLRWSGSAPTSADAAPSMVERVATGGQNDDLSGWRTLFASGTESRLVLAPKETPKNLLTFAFTEFVVPEPADVEFLASSAGSLEIWLNGKSIYRRPGAQAFRADSDRFSATLAKGSNRLLAQVAATGQPVELQMRFRRKSATAEHERLIQATLSRPGNVERGKSLFLNVEKSLCVKCHRFEDKGERTGPELTGVGSRFSRIYLAESILEPGRTIAPSFGTLTVVLFGGKVLSGIKVAETETTLTLADNQGQKHTLAKDDIELQRPSPLSSMPDGLEKRFTEEEFIDLIAFLAAQKESRPP